MSGLSTAEPGQASNKERTNASSGVQRYEPVADACCVELMVVQLMIVGSGQRLLSSRGDEGTDDPRGRGVGGQHNR